MRIALISDLHANEVALKAVVADIEQIGADQIVCLGDLATLGPSPAAVVGMVREMAWPCILGNHDAFMIQPDLIKQYTQNPMVIESVDWCRSQLCREDLAFLATLKADHDIVVGAGTVRCYHGSPKSHMDDIIPTATCGELDRMLDGVESALMAVGHTHIQMVLQHRGARIVNPGSVGLPFREYARRQTPNLIDGADYATIESCNGHLNVSLRNVPLKKSALRYAVQDSSIPLRPWLLQQYN